MAFLQHLLAQYRACRQQRQRIGKSAANEAIVIGGSMSGLFAGLQLRARGFAVDIYERVDSELSGRGAGIVAQPVVPRPCARSASTPPISASR